MHGKNENKEFNQLYYSVKLSANRSPLFACSAAKHAKERCIRQLSPETVREMKAFMPIYFNYKMKVGLFGDLRASAPGSLLPAAPCYETLNAHFDCIRELS